MIPNHLQALCKDFPIAKDERLKRGLSQILHQLIKTKSCILSEWSRSYFSFEAFIKKVSRFFRNKQCNWKMEPHLLSYLLPRFEKKKWIPILIDPSFVENRYLGAPTKTKKDQLKHKWGFFLFSAALPVRGRAISFFQAFYRYSQIDYCVQDSLNQLMGVYLIKITNLLNQCFAKAAFIMDRGFGYEYFLEKIKTLGGHYVIRVRDLKTHILLQKGLKKYSIQDLANKVQREPILFRVLYKGKIKTNLLLSKKGNSIWALLTDLEDPQDILSLYQQRMKIEETFKDWKSTGFNIEKIQIRQWDILPKMIWCVVIAHMILYLMGEAVSFSKDHKDYYKKFIRNKKDLSKVQLAWKIWLYAYNDLQTFLPLLFSYFNPERSPS